VWQLPWDVIQTREFPEIGLHQNRVHGILKLGGRYRDGLLAVRFESIPFLRETRSVGAASASQ
jgi:hypothetical protein